MRSTHLYGGILMTLVSLFCLFWLIPNHTEPAQSDLDLSPAFMPTVAMGTCLLMAVIMTITAWHANRNAAPETHDEFGAEATGGTARFSPTSGLWAITAFVSLALLDTIGFEVAMSPVPVSCCSSSWACATTCSWPS